MEENVGPVERIIRIIVGIGIVSLSFLDADITWIWAYVGLVPIVTGIVGCCPLYALLGITTCKTCKPCKKIGYRNLS